MPSEDDGLPHWKNVPRLPLRHIAVCTANLGKLMVTSEKSRLEFTA